MKIIYTPENGESREFTWEPDEFSAIEAELIEEAGGTQWQTYGEWANRIDTGGFRAWRVTLWVLMRRSNPDLNLNQVQPSLKEVFFLHSDQPASNEESEQEPGKDEPDDTPTDST